MRTGPFILFLFVLVSVVTGYNDTGDYYDYTCFVTPSSPCNGTVLLSPGQSIIIAIRNVTVLMDLHVKVIEQSEEYYPNLELYVVTAEAFFDPSLADPSPESDMANHYEEISGDMYVVIANDNYTTYQAEPISFSYNVYLKPMGRLEELEGLVACIIVCVIMVLFYRWFMQCCCCFCPPSVPKSVPFSRNNKQYVQYVYEGPPYPLISFPESVKFLQRFFTKPVVSFMVYCFNNNDILWIFYPDIGESLSFPARIFSTFLNMLFTFTFQGTWSNQLISGLDHLGKTPALAVSAIGGSVITSAVITIFGTLLNPIIRILSRSPKKMLFASSPAPAKRYLGIFLNFFIIALLLGVSAMCVVAMYSKGAPYFLLNFFLFTVAIIGRMFFPGIFMNYAFFRIYATFGAFPEGLIYWEPKHKVYYIQYKEDPEQTTSPLSPPSSSILSPQSSSLNSEESPESSLPFSSSSPSYPITLATHLFDHPPKGYGVPIESQSLLSEEEEN